MKCTLKTTNESTTTSNSESNPSNLPKNSSTQFWRALTSVTLFLATLNLAFFCKGVNAEVVLIGEELAMRTILGEAEGEPYLGKIGVAETLRTRRSVKGFYGAKAIRFDGKNYWRGNRKIDAVTVGQALKAWRESEFSNVSHGATHFENVEAFGIPYWAHSMTPTVKIGSHQFYREVRK